MANLSFKNQLRLMREQLGMEQAFSAQQAQRQMEFQAYMSNTAHRREVLDLQAAGLNPVLSANGGSGASSPSGAAGDTASIAGMIPQMLALAQSATKAASTSARAAGGAANAAGEVATAANNVANSNSGSDLLNIFEKPGDDKYYDDNPGLKIVHDNFGDKEIDLGFAKPTVDEVAQALYDADKEYDWTGKVNNTGKDVIQGWKYIFEDIANSKFFKGTEESNAALAKAKGEFEKNKSPAYRKGKRQYYREREFEHFMRLMRNSL